ncbi:MAG: gamma-glutamylcyclotransferase [Gemmatimonadetes bacterium]|nr:gamma-glutamylcyclotransferase [Gemmatimonadota bacterium]
MPVRVFVYGTLRKDARGSVQNALTRDWIFEGYGRVAAELFDFGAYPGAVPRAGVSVRGELYRLPDPRESLTLLDHYEGCGPEHTPPYEFERELVEVTLEDGGSREAWVYWYRPEPRGRKLASGDYVERTGPGGVTRQ